MSHFKQKILIDLDGVLNKYGKEKSYINEIIKNSEIRIKKYQMLLQADSV